MGWSSKYRTSFGWEGVLKPQNLVVYLLSNSWRSLLEVLPVIHLKTSISFCKQETGANAHKLHVKLSGCIFQISDRKGKNISFYPMFIFWLSLSKEWGSESPIITIYTIYSLIWIKSHHFWINKVVITHVSSKNHQTIPHSQLTGQPVALPETNSHFTPENRKLLTPFIFRCELAEGR